MDAFLATLVEIIHTKRLRKACHVQSTTLGRSKRIILLEVSDCSVDSLHVLDGLAIGAEDTSPPYSILWDSTGADDGDHQLAARARDGAGNTATSLGITVSVENGNGPPAVTLSGPAGPVQEMFTATVSFSEDVTGFTMADIAAGNATLGSFTAVSASVYTVDVSPSADPVTLDVPAGGVVEALDSNGAREVSGAGPAVLSDWGVYRVR